MFILKLPQHHQGRAPKGIRVVYRIGDIHGQSDSVDGEEQIAQNPLISGEKSEVKRDNHQQNKEGIEVEYG